MKHRGLFGVTVILIWAMLAGCSQTAPEKPSDKQYDIKGKVVAIDPDKTAVTLDHEDIPGLMKGMEMKFKVEAPKLLDGISSGDQVQGRLRVEDGKYIITQLKKK